MKQKMIILILVCLLLLTSTFTVLAGGDKVRGDKGVGDVSQHQVMDPPPFNP